MKLIPIIIWVTNLALYNEAHQSLSFAPQFQGQNAAAFSTEKQFYLPPESPTAAPYLPMKNLHSLPFPYLPPSATKFVASSPSTFHAVPSTTTLPMNFNDDKEDNDDKSSTQFPYYTQKQSENRTQWGPIQKAERRDMGILSKNFQFPIDRIDAKLPFQFNNSPNSTTQNLLMQPISRSIVISDIQRDHNIDQVMAPSYQSAQYLSPPSIFMSTTETAIPILRLSNEMDLDGSFSYEALGADQTHYVQHSRMENAGGDKEEQVVEGSYSYVGDNGKTYTVHYIADSNGFRASGDHLPVPPPIPEIIQRAVQYNLAEELKSPPHLRSWSDEEREDELSESERRNRFAVSPPRLNNLFTGKTPESFSHSFSQTSNTQDNVVAAASSHIPIQTVDYRDQNKQNSGTISPQITFIASQGAHIPSVSVPQQQQQQNVGKVFTAEKPSLPQIVNYEADIKDSDQENNKALWRWQYGINANSNQNMDKNQISRSFGEDDIIINFNDMTADQYSKLIEQQLQPTSGQTSEMQHQLEISNNEGTYNTLRPNYNVGNEHQVNNNNFNTVSSTTNVSDYTPESITLAQNSLDWYINQNFRHQSNNESIINSNDENRLNSQDEGGQTSRPRLITQDQFVPRSQTVTQAYNYDDTGFDSRKTRILYKNKQDLNLNVIPLDIKKSISTTTHKKENIAITTPEPSFWTTDSNIKFTDFIVSEDKNEFKPIFRIPESRPKEITTTTEANIENMLEENIFLKNMFRNNHKLNSRITDENKNLQATPIVDTRTHKYPNPKSRQPYMDEPHNEIKTIKKKALDIADIMNYLSRNQFESNKIMSKPQHSHNNFKQKNEMQYFTGNDEQETNENKNTRDLRTFKQQEELRGVIKNYKILQRNNNFMYGERDDINDVRRNSSPASVKAVNLPPLGRAGPAMKSYIPPAYL